MASIQSERVKGVQAALKMGVPKADIADHLARLQGVDIGAARSAGATDDDIIAELVTVPGKQVDPYAAASKNMPSGMILPGGVRRLFVPLGSALMAPAQGVQQIMGNDSVGLNAVEAQEGIARTIPGGQAGMTAGHIGVTSMLLAPTAPLGAGVAGLRGVAARAAASGGTLAGAEALRPMSSDQSRSMEAAKSGAFGLVASPVAEAVFRGAGAVSSELKSLIPNVVQRLANRFSATASQPSGAAIEQELIVSLRAQGVDYARLNRDMQQQLLTMTRDALSGEGLSNNALVRAARVEQTIGVPATRGQAERSTDIMRNEQQFGGQAIMQREAAQNDALRSSLERLATRRGGSLDSMQQGASFRSATLAKEAAADQAISDAYRVADDTVGDVPVSSDALADIIQNNPLVPGVDTVAAKLKKAGLKFNKSGELIAGQSVPARYLGEIRKVASQMTQSPERAAIGKATKDAIDDTFAGSGISQYADAVNLARSGFRQFADRQIPAGITATRKGVEDITATSKLADWVMSKSPEQLRELKMFFARGNEQALREFYRNSNATMASGVQAVNDLKAAAIGAIVNKGMRKSVTAEGGTWTTSPDAIVTAYRQFGGGNGPAAIARADAKMRAILGANDFAEFKRIMKVAEDLSVPGRAQMKGSAEANTGLAMRIIGLLGMSPAVGIEAVGSARGALQSVSAKKSAQWSAQEQAKSMRKPEISKPAVETAGRVGSLATLIGNR